MANASKKASPLGRLTALGPQSIAQTPLLLPESWDDLRDPITHFHRFWNEGDAVLVNGRLMGTPDVRFINGKPIMRGSIVGADGTYLSFSEFGDTRDLQTALLAHKDNLFVFGKISFFNQQVVLKNPQVIDPRWVGRLRPRYAGKPRVIKPDTVRQRIVSLLREALPAAAEVIVNELEYSPEAIVRFANVEGVNSVERLLLYAHIPYTLEQGLACHEALECLAALRAVRLAREQAPKPSDSADVAMPRCPGDWRGRASQLPFTLSSKQALAIEEIVHDLRQRTPMRRLLSGDVGFGKTAVFAVAATTVYDAGGRVAILLPNETLAEQAYRELVAFWPDLKEACCLVTGSSGTDAQRLEQARWLIGTTALLFRDVGEFHLVVVDEQQKFSRAQRETLLQSHTHLLEATATCIPRTQALIQFGGFSATLLDEPPIARTITTKVRFKQERTVLFQDAKATLEAGDQVLVVYPRRASKEDDEEGIHDVEAAAEAWERLLPGRIRIAHSGRPEEDNEAALRDMREEAAQVLIATTVVEVGVNIPRLRRVIIVHPHRFGLSTLHQIRGRVARTGGQGYCDLYLPDPPKEKSLQRLRVLEKTQNGFEVAREDLMLRGCGNLNADSEQQTGADETILFGRPLTPDRLEEAISRESRL